ILASSPLPSLYFESEEVSKRVRGPERYTLKIVDIKTQVNISLKKTVVSADRSRFSIACRQKARF
ncbi:hypothetical protein, partial [Metabacillus mangrovi]|uniref:hypothetical protein n=1 Tax=Metabacillus mangrovi TaxID=1491830 RepID=UPI0019D65D89